jgi:hypothetical protein
LIPVGFAAVSCYDDLMKAYVGCIDHSGLQRFLPEGKLPRGVLQELAVGWSSPTTTPVWAVLTAHDAEAVRQDLEAGCPRAACGLLLNRAVELLPLAAVARHITETPMN